MPRVAVTSLVRHTDLVEPSGFLRILDLDSGRVLSVSTVPESMHRARDPNPRGGLRGAKGISAYGGRLVVANVERLFVLERDWSVGGEITHPWLGGIHDVLCEADGIWITCTDSDLLAKMTWAGALTETWDWRADERLVESLGFSSVPAFEPGLDYRDPVTSHTGVRNAAHLNALVRDGADLIVSFGRIMSARLLRSHRLKGGLLQAAARVGLARAGAYAVSRARSRRIARQALPVERIPRATSALVRVSAGARRRGEVLLRVPAVAGVPNHNVALADASLVYNDSNAGCLVGHPLTDGTLTRIPIPGAPPFPRGLAPLAPGVFLVGSQAPAALHAVDLQEQRLLWSIPLGGVERESVYAVAVLPDDFDDPPAAVFRPPQ